MSEQLQALKPIPINYRLSVLFVEKGNLDVLDGAFVVVDKSGVRTHIPVGGVACLMLEVRTGISHAAVNLAAKVGTLLVCIGEAGVRLYSAGQPGGARSDRLLHQAKLALDDEARLKVVREMYHRRFGEEAPARRSVEQLHGIVLPVSAIQVIAYRDP
jgi:CRISP-associated protein Cas1